MNLNFELHSYLSYIEPIKIKLDKIKIREWFKERNFIHLDSRKWIQADIDKKKSIERIRLAFPELFGKK